MMIIEVLMSYFAMTDINTKEIHLIKILEIELSYLLVAPDFTHQCREIRVLLIIL